MLRINDNAVHLERWRACAFAPGSHDFILGEALGFLAAALGVLLMAEFGWNLSVIHQAKVPKASPDPGEDGHPTYRIPVVKYRHGGGRYFESRNVTDDGSQAPRDG